MATVDIKKYHKGTISSKSVLTAQRLAKDISTHIDGSLPEKLVSERRPNEGKDAHKYRKDIWQAVTRQMFTGVIMSLQKIRKSDDYVWKWNEQARPNNVAKDELLREYTEKKFPMFGSYDNWYWSVCFPQSLKDANAVSIIWPANMAKADNEYFQPYPNLFRSELIKENRPGELLVVRSEEEAYYTAGNNQRYDAAVYYSVDAETITRYQQTGYDTFSSVEFPHGLGYMPVVMLRGEIADPANMVAISRLHGMVPYLNEAVREYSDMQLEVVQHIHSTLWTLQAAECKTCKGTGLTPSQEGAVKCSECNGKGHYPMNPGEVMVIRQPGPGENPVPTPPAGFIQKDIEIAKLQNERILSHIYNAYSAINFEWKMNVPMSQSGIAKQWDRSEFNNFVYTVAEDAVRQIDEHLRIICDYRYSTVVTDHVRRYEMLPSIGVPVKYDILPDQMLTEEINRLRTAKVSPVIINAAEIEYAAKKFNSDPAVRDKVKATYELDPFAGVSEDDLMVRLSNGVISKEAYFLHANIVYLIDEAVAADQNFMSYPIVKRREILMGMAKRELAEMAPSGRVLSMVTDTSDNGGQGAADDSAAS
jgi:hypothetical protein